MSPPPPGKQKLCWGRGRNPHPSLPERAGGGGEIVGAAPPRQQHPDWLTWVTCQPPPSPPPPRGPVFRRFLGVAQGAKEAAWPWPISRDPGRCNAAASPFPWLPIPLSSTLSPPLASPYGFSMAAAAREHALRKRKGSVACGEGKGVPEPTGRAAERMRPQAPSPPRQDWERAQWVGRKRVRRADLFSSLR